MVATRFVTAEALAARPDDERLELIEGELVEMSPTKGEHLIVTSDLVEALVAYALTGVGVRALVGEGGYFLRRHPDTVLAPDIAVVTAEQRRAVKQARKVFPEVVPLLVVEVKSPSGRESRISRKTALYLAAGVREVWWVRPEEQQVWIHRDEGARVVPADGTLESPDLLPGFALPLAELFAE